MMTAATARRKKKTMTTTTKRPAPPMVLVMAFLLLGAVGLGRHAVEADRDDSYYNANSGNPNVELKMYWKDSYNVLEDLYQFEALYVEYHSCVWSWMKYGEGYSDEEIDENDYWYMDSVPPMGPNAAFSLYGSLAGEKFTGCNKDTFINSFYTNSGYTDFARSMYYAGMSGFSSYMSSGSASCQGGYGIACEYGNFAKHSYSTDVCDPAYYSATTDSMDSLNSAMQNAQCIQIYDVNWGISSSNIYNTPLEILGYSTACDYMNMVSPDGKCPDPYGQIQYYIKNFNEGIKKHHEDPFQIYDEKIERAWTMVKVGGIFMGLAFLVLLLDKLSSYFIVKNKCIEGIDTTRLVDDMTATISKGSRYAAEDGTEATLTSLWKRRRSDLAKQSDNGGGGGLCGPDMTDLSEGTVDEDVVKRLHADQQSKTATSFFRIEENFSDLSGSHAGVSREKLGARDNDNDNDNDNNNDDTLGGTYRLEEDAAKESTQKKKSLGKRLFGRLRGKGGKDKEEGGEEDGYNNMDEEPEATPPEQYQPAPAAPAQAVAGASEAQEKKEEEQKEQPQQEQEAG